MSRRAKWIVAAVVLIVAAGPVGAWVYFNVIAEDAPDPLTLTDEPTATTEAPATGDISGTWRPTTGTEVGYRVDEVAFGQSKTAAGRTNKVTGTMTIQGTTVSAVDLTVDMASITSDEGRRDNQFRGRIMSVDQFPTSRFVLSTPINLSATSGTVAVTVTGKLTLRGTTKDVTVGIKAQRSGANIRVNGSIPIVFADWNIPNPSTAAISTEDHGELEFLVVFAKG